MRWSKTYEINVIEKEQQYGEEINRRNYSSTEKRTTWTINIKEVQKRSYVKKRREKVKKQRLRN